jgi:hypothetical protein
MNTQDQISDFLQLSSLDYDTQTFGYYFSWCQVHGKTPMHVQQLLANATINRWFLVEFNKLENDFIGAIPFLIKSKKNLNHEYQAIAGNIFSIYPQPLIDAIKCVIDKDAKPKTDQPKCPNNFDYRYN